MENEFYLQQQQQNLYNLNSYLNNNNWDTSFHSTLTTSVHPQPQADPLISTDPSFVERAARLSMFGRRSFNGRIVVDEGELELGFPTVSSCQGLEFSSPAGHDFVKIKERIQHGFSPENGEESSSVSEPQKSTSVNDINPRKRKSNPRAKSDESDETEKSGRKAKVKPKDDSRNSDEPTKDYIHVRARRGQATDSHSLAERVRREKISQRMKFLQDLVPGCNKVTGKAMMLDEIINYVQSLQRQVEFLSMKLSIVNPTTDINIEVLLSKDLHRAKSLLSQSMLALETSSISPALSYGYPSRSSMTPLSTQRPNNVVQLQPSMDGFDQSSSQVSLWIDELHNVVQMGHGQNELQKFLASLTTSDAKMKQ